MYLEKVNVNDKEEIRGKLIALCDCDSDMNGDNGIEYLWDEASGYESNAEYLADYAMKNSKTVKEMFEKFINKWMERDYNYYSNYDLTFFEEGKTYLIIAYASVHNNEIA